MSNIQVDLARNSILHVYELIQALFTLPKAPAQNVITELMQAFAESFSMVTPDGTVLGRDQIRRLFCLATGTRPGLEIRIRDMRTIWHDKNSVALRFKEVQRVAGVETACLSVVIMDIAQSAARWKFLHETKARIRGHWPAL